LSAVLLKKKAYSGGVLMQSDPIDITKIASDDELLDRVGCGWLPVTEQDELIRVLVVWRDRWRAARPS
jgi:hypothetical protein